MSFAFLQSCSPQWPVKGKTCSKCMETKPRDQFYVRKTRPNGDDREAACKACRIAQVMRWKRG